MMSPEDLNSSNFKMIVMKQYLYCIISFIITQLSICHVVRSKFIEAIVQIWINAHTSAKFKFLH